MQGMSMSDPTMSARTVMQEMLMNDRISGSATGMNLQNSHSLKPLMLRMSMNDQIMGSMPQSSVIEPVNPMSSMPSISMNDSLYGREHGSNDLHATNVHERSDDKLYAREQRLECSEFHGTNAVHIEYGVRVIIYRRKAFDVRDATHVVRELNLEHTRNGPFEPQWMYSARDVQTGLQYQLTSASDVFKHYVAVAEYCNLVA